MVASATGNSAASATPAVATTFANDLLVGANLVQSLTITGRSGFTTRVITSPTATSSRIASSRRPGYSASANIAAAWIMQLAAFASIPEAGGAGPGSAAGRGTGCAFPCNLLPRVAPTVIGLTRH